MVADEPGRLEDLVARLIRVKLEQVTRTDTIGYSFGCSKRHLNII